MSIKTQRNLAYAFAAESMASVRNDVFGRKADAEGYVAENEAPQDCPVCGAVKGKFKKID